MVKSCDFPAKSISNQPSQASHRKSRGSCPKGWDDIWYPHKLPARFWGPLPEVGVGASSDRWLKKWLGVVVAVWHCCGCCFLVWQYANGSLYIYIYNYIYIYTYISQVVSRISQPSTVSPGSEAMGNMSIWEAANSPKFHQSSRLGPSLGNRQAQVAQVKDHASAFANRTNIHINS